MSRENVGVVRQGYELFNRTGEIDPAMYDPDFEFHDFAESPEPVRHGVEAWEQWTRDIREAFGDFVLEPSELIDAGDRVLALVVMRAQGRASGVPMELQFGVLWNLRHGKMTKCEVFRDQREARRAAGLSE